MPEFGPNKTNAKRRFDDAVNRERDLRGARGTDVHVTGYGWICLQGRPEDRDALAGLSQAADTAVRMGLDGLTYYFTDRENRLHILSAPQVMELFVKGADYISQLHFSSVVLKAQPDLSVNIPDDAHWFPKTVKPVEAIDGDVTAPLSDAKQRIELGI